MRRLSLPPPPPLAFSAAPLVESCTPFALFTDPPHPSYSPHPYRLKLIRGTLDQVSSSATISWVQPRVLDRPQIEALRARLDEWTDKVSAQGEYARAQAPELFVQA